MNNKTAKYESITPEILRILGQNEVHLLVTIFNNDWRI